MLVKLHLNRKNEYKLRKCLAGRKFLDTIANLPAFPKFRKEIINFAISVYLSVLIEQVGSNSMEFHDILYKRIFRKYVEKIQFSFKFDKRNGYFVWRPMYISNSISLNYF